MGGSVGKNSGDGMGKRCGSPNGEEGSIIDGLTFDAAGRLLITDYYGRLMRYTQGWEVKELVNMDSQGRFFADFGFIEGLGVVVIPTYSDNRLVAFKLMD